MELRVSELAIPERIDWNYEELKTGLKKATEEYKGLVYTDANIKDAKKDVASLRKLKDVLNSERIRLQKEYLAPFAEFKKQVDELIALIDEPLAAIDTQVKEYNNMKAKEKAEAIDALVKEKAFPEGYNLGPIYNPKWVNATYSLKKISEELDAAKAKILDDILTIEGLTVYQFEAMDVYKRTLDIRTAISEVQRLMNLAKRKEEAELRRRQEEEARAARMKAEEDERNRQANLKVLDEANKADAPVEYEYNNRTEAPAPVEYAVEEPVEAPTREWVTFSAYVTVDEAKALAAWLKERGISIRA